MTPYFREQLGCEGPQMSQHDTLTQALQQIAAWNSHTTEYAIDYGSNGVRDFYRNIARLALSATQPAQADRHLTVTTTPAGEAVMVSWQDDEHRILEVVWGRQPAQAAHAPALRAARRACEHWYKHGASGFDVFVKELSRALSAQAAQGEPKVNIKAETCSNGVTGTTYLNVVRIEVEDDGSLTAVTDAWVQPAVAQGAGEHVAWFWRCLTDKRSTNNEPGLIYIDGWWGRMSGWGLTGNFNAIKNEVGLECRPLIYAPTQPAAGADVEPEHVTLLNEKVRELGARDAFETQNKCSHGFKRSARGTYVNPPVARDWKWFQLGIQHANKDTA